MKLNYKNSKTIGSIIGIVLFIALIGGITYAAFNWRSTNTNISAVSRCFDIVGSSSYSVSGSNMLLFDENDILDTTNNTITYKNGMIYYPFEISRQNGCDIPVYYEITVNVTTLSSDYRNGSLKYKVIEDMSSYTSNQIANPLDEDLGYIIEGSIYNLGNYKIYAKNLNNNVTPAVIFYLDGDLVPEDASNLTFNATVDISANQGNMSSAGQYITNLYTDADKSTATVNNITYNLAPSVGLMNDRHASMSTDINGGDIRYYGANPNNYVWLGDTYTSDYTMPGNITLWGYADKQECISGEGYDEEEGAIYCTEDIVRHTGDKKLWRIVGVFNDKLKLVSNDPISSQGLSWDTSANTTGGNYGYGINQWGPSGTYEGADLMRLLNPGYESTGVNNSLYWNKGTGTVYSGRSNATTSNISFANTGLTANERSLIDTATWYTGAYDQNSYADAHYTAERGTMGKICSGGNWCNDEVTRTSTWTGKVGLIYPSDYGYAANLAQCNQILGNYNETGCNDTDWLKSTIWYWTMSPRTFSVHAYNVFYVYDDGDLYSDSASIDGAVRPAVYLKEGVTIASGTGTEEDPYVLDYYFVP